jgi:hypothetical protein
LEAVLKAHLDGVTDTSDSTALQIRVAKLVTSAPSSMGKEEYLQRLSPQIVDLFHVAIDIDDKVCGRDTCTMSCWCVTSFHALPVASLVWPVMPDPTKDMRADSDSYRARSAGGLRRPRPETPRAACNEH